MPQQFEGIDLIFLVMKTTRHVLFVHVRAASWGNVSRGEEKMTDFQGRESQ